MKFKLLIASLIFALVTYSSAATYFVSNVIGGVAATDALYQNTDNSLMNGGIVTLGYFNSNAYVPSSNLALIATTIADFTVLASGTPGTFSSDLGGSYAGFVQAAGVNSVPATITIGNAVLGRTLYVFAGNGASLSVSTAWALKAVNTIGDDDPTNQEYLANPLGGAAPVIGTIGSYTGNAGGQGSGTFSTLQLEAIPEPSTFLLSSLGVLALLRRRR